MGGANSAAKKTAIAARRPLIRPPLIAPRDNIDPQYSAIVNMEAPLRTTPGQRRGCLQLLLHALCGPSPTGRKITRIQGCRGAKLLPEPPYPPTAQVPVTPREGYAHERRRHHRRNPQARGNGVSLLLSPQPLDRSLRRARHPSDSVPARARGRRP